MVKLKRDNKEKLGVIIVCLKGEAGDNSTRDDGRLFSLPHDAQYSADMGT